MGKHKIEYSFKAFAQNNFKLKNKILQQCLSEVLATFILLTFVIGASIQSMLANFHISAKEPQLTPILGSSFGMMGAIIICGGVSGAQMNPAVTLGFALHGDLSWVKVPLYWMAQLLGAFLGTAMGFFLNASKLNSLSGEFELVTFFPDPSYLSQVPNKVSLGDGIFEQIVCTALHMLMVLACNDRMNMQMHKSVGPIANALVVAALSMAFPRGAILNPARDLSPRLFGLIIGYDLTTTMQNLGLDGLTKQNWWIVGILGPMIGASLASIIYSIIIGAQLPTKTID